MPSPASSLTTLLRLAFADQVNWLSTPPSSNQSVRWVVTSLAESRADDLLLILASDLDQATLNQARERRLAAILALGSAPRISKVISDLPVAWTSGESDLREAEKLLLTLLVNQRAALMERGVRIHTQLAQAAAEGAGLAGLVQGIAEISGRGVLVQDKRLTIVVNCPSPALAAIWDELLPQISQPELLPENLRDRKLAGRQAAILRQELPGDLMRLVTPIIAGEVARGYLSLVGFPRELDALDLIVAEQGALVCAVEMARAKAVREAEKRLKGDLLTALIHEDLSPRDARLWAQSMGVDLERSHAALRFAWDGQNSPSRRRLETIINGELAAADIKATTSLMGPEVACFCQEESETERPLTSLALAQAVIAQGQLEYPDQPIRCGLGHTAGDLGDWRISFRQAGQALEMARRFREDRPLYFPDLSVYRLLMQMEHNPELAAFRDEILGPILESEHPEELVRTLEAYFEHNTNLTQTAEALFIHRNTMLYRINRIATISNLDLDQAETRLALQLALIIYRMLGNRPS